jgi:predicted P-loop ATPase
MKLINFILPSLKAQLSVGHIEASDLLSIIQKYSGPEGYYCLFDLEPRDSFQGYRGFHTPALGYYVLDFDSSSDMDLARRDCLTTIEKLSLPKDTYKVYFSGGKGFHLYIRQEFFSITPSDRTAKDFENLAVSIAKSYDLPTLDDSIYQANRKFRIPNSKHPKTGLYKIELTLDQLCSLTLDAIKDLAKSPGYVTLANYTTPSTKYAKGSVTSVGSVALSASQFGLDRATTQDITSGGDFSAYRNKPCIESMATTKHKEGRRHEVAITIIADYYHQGRKESEAEAVIQDFCRLNGISERFEKDYLRAISDIYSGKNSYTFGCYSKIKKEFCSGQCPLYKRLSPSLRAEVTDFLSAPPHTASPATTMETGDAPTFPDTAKSGPLSTVKNIEALLNFYQISVSYDVIKKDINVSIPAMNFLKDTAKESRLTHIVSLAKTHRIPRGDIEEFVAYIANQNPTNPVARWITSEPWDGVSRLQAFYDTLTTKESDKPLKETLMRKWMLSAIAAAFSPNGSAGSGILVLQGEQYIGKTKWFKDLVPAELEVTKDGMMLDPKDKDSVYQCVTNWLVELGEVDATFRKADIAQLKAFLTKDTDILRLAYGRKTSEFARRTVFFASVNQMDYLSDPTGNRRFWTIQCTSIKHSHGLPMQQIWAEFYELWKKGESYYLNAEEMRQLNTHNMEFQATDPFEEMYLERYYTKADGEKQGTEAVFKSSLNILESFQIKNPTRSDFTRLRSTLAHLKVDRTKDKGVRGYLVYPKEVSDDDQRNTQIL